MTPKLTALAEFDLIEAQDFYAPKGAWVLDHFMNSIAEAMVNLEKFAGIHPKHYGHHCKAVRQLLAKNFVSIQTFHVFLVLV